MLWHYQGSQQVQFGYCPCCFCYFCHSNLYLDKNVLMNFPLQTQLSHYSCDVLEYLVKCICFVFGLFLPLFFFWGSLVVCLYLVLIFLSFLAFVFAFMQLCCYISQCFDNFPLIKLSQPISRQFFCNYQYSLPFNGPSSSFRVCSLSPKYLVMLSISISLWSIGSISFPNQVIAQYILFL